MWTGWNSHTLLVENSLVVPQKNQVFSFNCMRQWSQSRVCVQGDRKRGTDRCAHTCCSVLHVCQLTATRRWQQPRPRRRVVGEPGVIHPEAECCSVFKREGESNTGCDTSELESATLREGRALREGSGTERRKRAREDGCRGTPPPWGAWCRTNSVWLHLPAGADQAGLEMRPPGRGQGQAEWCRPSSCLGCWEVLRTEWWWLCGW